MKKTNDIVTIAKNDFVVSDKAKIILDEYLQGIRKKYRLNTKAQKELQNALRDVLLTMQTKKQTQISEKTAQQAVQMVGTTYEETSTVKKLLKASVDISKNKLKLLKKLCTNKKYQNRFFCLIAFSMLIPLGLGIAQLSFFKPEVKLTNGNDYYTYQSEIGWIIPGNYMRESMEKNPWTTNASIDSPLIILISIIALLSILFFGLARRAKYTKVVLALVIVLTVTHLAINNNILTAQYDLRTGISPFAGQPNREVTDYDKLIACGTKINYVTGYESGKIFYYLKDKGFELAKELQQNSNYYKAPLREELCRIYDELRQSYPDESIVVQEYIIDKNKEIRPWDIEEHYSQYASEASRKATLQYGFFVKK